MSGSKSIAELSKLLGVYPQGGRDKGTSQSKPAPAKPAPAKPAPAKPAPAKALSKASTSAKAKTSRKFRVFVTDNEDEPVLEDVPKKGPSKSKHSKGKGRAEAGIVPTKSTWPENDQSVDEDEPSREDVPAKKPSKSKHSKGKGRVEAEVAPTESQVVPEKGQSEGEEEDNESEDVPESQALVLKGRDPYPGRSDNEVATIGELRELRDMCGALQSGIVHVAEKLVQVDKIATQVNGIYARKEDPRKYVDVPSLKMDLANLAFLPDDTRRLLEDETRAAMGGMAADDEQTEEEQVEEEQVEEEQVADDEEDFEKADGDEVDEGSGEGCGEDDDEAEDDEGAGEDDDDDEEVAMPVLPTYIGQSKPGKLAAAQFITDNFLRYSEVALLRFAKTASLAADDEYKVEKIAVKAAKPQKAKRSSKQPLPLFSRDAIQELHQEMVDFQNLAILNPMEEFHDKLVEIADVHEKAKKGSVLLKMTPTNYFPGFIQKAKINYAANAVTCFGYNLWAGKQMLDNDRFLLQDPSPFTKATGTHLKAYIDWRVKHLGFPKDKTWNGKIEDWDAEPFSLVIDKGGVPSEDEAPPVKKQKTVNSGKPKRTIQPTVTSGDEPPSVKNPKSTGKSKADTTGKKA